MKFKLYARVSTEDRQDPKSSLDWQRHLAESLITAHGTIVATSFDHGQSRSLPWSRRSHASALLAELPDPDRGYDAVVVGETKRAFYGNQASLVLPVFDHYGVGFWTPQLGGPYDPHSTIHKLIFNLDGGMSEDERERIKVRVRTAMEAQARLEGRFLGGRPPYGYQLADAGPHPNPGKAADERHLRVLVPDLATAPIVKRIFDEWLGGRGLRLIAQGLTLDGVPSPSAHDRVRNSHRCGVSWSKSAIRAILHNPRYTGFSVWNKQRKEEVLLDVREVADGYRTKQTWNPAEEWIWSTEPTHEAIVPMETWEAAQRHGTARTPTRERRSRPY